MSETAAGVEAHLAGCARCSEARAQMSAVLEMTKAWSVEGGDILADVQQRIDQDEMRSLLLEVRRLRSEVDSLHAEVAQLKIRATRPAVTIGRENSVLRFPQAAVRSVTHSRL